MKRIYISFMAAAVLLSGCNKPLMQGGDSSNGKGEVSFDITASGEYVTITKSAAEDNADVNEFKIDIVNNAGVGVASYDRFGDMPHIMELPSGQYTLTAMSPNVLPAAFDLPVYGKAHNFIVRIGEVTSEKIECTLQNMKITFSLSQAFRTELDTYTITVSNGDSASNTLQWTNVAASAGSERITDDINKAGYFSVAPLTIRVDAKRAIDNSEAYHEIKIADGKAQDHFKVSLDAKVTGNAGFTLDVDYSVNDRDQDVYIPGFGEDPVDGGDQGNDGGGSGNDDPGQGGDPDDGGGSDPDDGGGSGSGTAGGMELLWPSNPSLGEIDINDGMSVELTLNVPEGIEEFTIDVTSDTQAFLYLVSLMTSTPQEVGSIDYVHIDLINDPAAVSAMKGVGLKTGDELKDQTIVEFSLSSLIPMIPSAGQAGPDTYHTFELSVTDKAGNSASWPLTFHVPA